MKNKNRNQNKKIRKTGIGIGISIIKNWFITGNKIRREEEQEIWSPVVAEESLSMKNLILE